MKKVFLLLAVCNLLFSNVLFAQKENYIWYFGMFAGLDFNSGAPVALTNSAMNQGEGCSSISDGNGNLLFYTNGAGVWDRNHIQMPNGNGLNGGWSSTQSALIVPFPVNNNLYYIFTTTQLSMALSNYSIVNMLLNGGNGDITIKNNLLNNQSAEKLTAVKHANNNDVWVMLHGAFNNSFYAYLVTASGISPPVISNAGPVFSGNASIGYMKFSPDGAKIAYAAQLSFYVGLFDFDAGTGNVTNEKYLSLAGLNADSYGVEFSSTGKYLFCSCLPYNKIYQWDITSNDTAIINSTRQLIVSSASPSTFGALQIGPDGKIYVDRNGSDYLDVINYPDSSGVLCNYVDSAISLSGKTCWFGLPNFITSYFLPTGINSNIQPQNQITISPNPASDKITITGKAADKTKYEITISDITGRQCLQTPNTLLPTTIYISRLQQGIYFVTVSDGEARVVRKVVKQ